MWEILLQETFNEEREGHLFGAVHIHVDGGLIVDHNALTDCEELGVELCVTQMFKVVRYSTPGFRLLTLSCKIGLYHHPRGVPCASTALAAYVSRLVSEPSPLGAWLLIGLGYALSVPAIHRVFIKGSPQLCRQTTGFLDHVRVCHRTSVN